MLRFFFFLLIATFALVRADNWHLDVVNTLVNEELDPVVSPNGQASHMHKVIGGSRFGASYNYDDYNSAKCSSLAPQADKSGYWMPGEFDVDSTVSRLMSCAQPCTGSTELSTNTSQSPLIFEYITRTIVAVLPRLLGPSPRVFG
jgi:hypothetical protein